MTNKDDKIKALEDEFENMKRNRKPLGKDEEIKLTLTSIGTGQELTVLNDGQRPQINSEPTMNISTSDDKEKTNKEEEQK